MREHLTSHFTPQQLADLRFLQHVSEFDILRNLVGNECLSAPFDEIIAGDAFYVFLQDHDGLDSSPTFVSDFVSIKPSTTGREFGGI